MIQMLTWLSVVMMHIHRVSQDLSLTVSWSSTARHSSSWPGASQCCAE